jgi:8-oxo-dGTP pyrophosphatase MutT (NUDIX family)
MVPAKPPHHGAPKEVESLSSRIKKQVVAGFVVYRRTQEGTKFLLLYRRGNYWNFPKGHFEAGENDLETALRETEEETGLKKTELRIIPEFRAYERFSFKRENQVIHDTVILFLAETHNPKVTISPREHSGFAWFLYQDAVKALGNKYVGTKQVLKKANDFLRQRSAARRRPGGAPPAHPPRPRAHA